jgi:hypothetical protein
VRERARRQAVQALSASWEPYHAAFQAVHELAAQAAAARAALMAPDPAWDAAGYLHSMELGALEEGQAGGGGGEGAAAGETERQAHADGGGGHGQPPANGAAAAPAAASAAAPTRPAEVPVAHPSAAAAVGAAAGPGARRWGGRAAWLLRVAPAGADARKERLTTWLMQALVHGVQVRAGRMPRRP